MGSMTQHIDHRTFIATDPLVDAQIKGFLRTICTAIAKSFRGVQSIILYGSFARGDACFSHIKHGEIVYGSDLDILVHTPYPYPKLLQRSLPAEIRQITKIIPVDLHFTRKLPGTQKRLLKDHFDILHAGKTIYGKEGCDATLITGMQLHPSEGLRLIFNRMYTHFLFSHQNTGINQETHTELVAKKSAKIILDCCQALLILSKRYDVQAFSTFNRVIEHINTDHPSLLTARPSFIDDIRWAKNVLTNTAKEAAARTDGLTRAAETLAACARYLLREVYEITATEPEGITHHFLQYHSKIHAISMLHYNLRLLIKQHKIYLPALKTFFIPACYYWYCALLHIYNCHGETSVPTNDQMTRALLQLKKVYPVSDSKLRCARERSALDEYLLQILAETATVSLQIV